MSNYVEEMERPEEILTVNVLKSTSTLTVDVRLEDVSVKAVVDTAAQVTIISDKLFKKLGWSGPVLKKVKLQTAGREYKLSSSFIGPL